MDVSQTDLIYSAQHRTTFLSHFMWFLGLLLVLVALLNVAVGSFGTGSWSNRLVDGGVLLVIGALLSGGHWLLTPRRYEIYDDAVVVAYGRPRVKVVVYEEISEIEVATHALGTELRLHLTRGGVVRLYPLGPREFHENLERAWKPHRGILTSYWP